MQDIKTLAKSKLAALGSTTALILSAGSFAATSAHADPEISGNISIVSDYVFRGITEETESDGPAVQGGFDIEYDSGFYAGWWASSLGYGTDNLTTTVENDFYFGFAGESGDFSYDFGLNYYWYMDDSDASGFEPYVTFGFGAFEIGAAYMAQDISWSNQGDVFWHVATGFDLGNDFELSLLAGIYTYSNSGKYIPSTENSSAFNHIDITLSKAIGDTPASMFASYIIAGEDRDGVSQKDKIVIGLSYSF